MSKVQGTDTGRGRATFQIGSVNQRKGGNEVLMMGGFHPIGNANKGLQESAGGGRKEPGCDWESQSQDSS